MPLNSEQRRELYHSRRSALIEELGGACVDCGTSEKLEFDHVFGKGYDQRKLNRLQRLRVIQREADRGEIAIRCRSCNARRGRPDVIGPEPPFTDEGTGWDDFEQ